MPLDRIHSGRLAIGTPRRYLAPYFSGLGPLIDHWQGLSTTLSIGSALGI
jgi:hypothetical protein